MNIPRKPYGSTNCRQEPTGIHATQSAFKQVRAATTDYVRQLRDVKIKPLVEVADFARLAHYAIWCGWALARAHAKSGDAATISGYLGNSTEFDDAVARFAMAYADQNARDHQAL